MAELGSHQLDAASIFISAMHGGKKQYPLNVAAAANRPLFPRRPRRRRPRLLPVRVPRPGLRPRRIRSASRKKISVAYASINGNGFGGYGETVFGTEGTLLLEREKEAMLYRTSRHDEQDPAWSTRRQADEGIDGRGRARRQRRSRLGGDRRRRPWQATSAAATPRRSSTGPGASANPDNPTRIQPHCHPKVALADAVIALTTNIAAREGQRIEFNQEWFDPDSDETPEGVKPDVSPVCLNRPRPGSARYLWQRSATSGAPVDAPAGPVNHDPD